MSLYNAGSSAGNIVGPLLFSANQAPEYKQGLKAVLGIFVALAAVVGLQLVVLMALNKWQRRRRVANGKREVIHDVSMEDHYVSGEEGLGSHAFDLTDRQNDEFVYIY